MTINIITQSELKKILHYNPDTGVFTWIVNISKSMKSGDVAGYLNSRGYMGLRIKRKNYTQHRLAWIYIYGINPDKDIDHIDLNKLNNRIDNLRIANDNENHWNVKLTKSNTSGFKGVCFDKSKNKWKSSIRFEGKLKHLGYYDCPEKAFERYNNFAKLHHGEFYRDSSQPTV